MSEWFSPRQLAMLRLGSTCDEKAIANQIRKVNRQAKNENWQTRVNTLGAPLARRRSESGGGWEYHYSVLPVIEQTKYCKEHLAPKVDTAVREVTKEALSRDEMWSWYDGIPDNKKQKAQSRLVVLDAVDTLLRGGTMKTVAVEVVARQYSTPSATIYRWFKLVDGVTRADWLPYLAPKHSGRSAVREIDPNVMDWIRSDYLRPERPTMKSCYRRLKAVAEKEGWPLPNERTVQRRIDDIPTTVRVLAREGLDALKKLYPAQERDRSVFHALEAVNADGHKFDVWVNWPGEEKPIRVMMIAVQDLYSGKILSWRIDKSENKEAVLLAFGDVIESYGIPDHVYLDNGRSFASKWITGGSPNRFRFKVKDEDPAGLLTNLGCTVHWTTPYSGQSKPIERAFRDMCDDISKHPAFSGAWTGNTVANKPENYGSNSVDLDTFIEIVASGIAEHNSREGRRAKVCSGRSFDQTFNESYARSPIQKATEAHRRLWLLAAENVRVRSNDATIHVLGNRFWFEALIEYAGQCVTARFDPDDLAAGLHIYRQDGAYVGFAECIEAQGFNDVAAAREHSRARRQFLNANKAMLAAERKMSPEQLAEMLPAMTAAPAPESKVVKPIFDKSLMTPPEPEPVADLSEEDQALADQMFAELNATGEEDTNVVHLHSEDERPFFDNDIDFVKWVLTSGKADEEDQAYAADLVEKSPTIRVALGAD